MPIYEYQCETCGTFETTQRITDKPLSKCPTCRGKVKKLISNTSFQLKGTGWYVTDYARKDKDKDKDAPKTENGSSSESKSDAKESKPDTKESKKETKKDSASAKSESSSTSNSTT